jgi:hypothetical protein
MFDRRERDPDACRRPTIYTTQNDYNKGMAWTTTATPPAANFANVQLAGSSAMQPGVAPSPIPLSESPLSPDIVDGDLASTPEHPYSKQCGLIGANGQPCLKVDPNRTSHFINDHVIPELEQIQRGSLDMSNARILKTDAEVLRAEALVVRCPYGCKWRGKPSTYSRQGHLLRHLRQVCKMIPDDEQPEAVSELEWTSKRGSDVLSQNSWRK